ncbi:hypothetical protein [Sphingomonas sanxanigenens]|uniref:Uncharacterized protein n=1 Tax=Sphingomonas sanxanigenens DSM 19645 = NX02 TaxID=1123269 RepID=W0A9V4_9SPHN|nr:hypothetical protein [Sphingomonas sanxanigenens]AHE52450.1 hypothetical protein NX02_03480 [Sphingomonas sanxanigenens DSM 19645 = NX02]
MNAAARISPFFTTARLGAAILALGFAASAPAVAQTYSAKEVGNWTVAASKDGQGCFLTRTYERAGRTTLLVGLEVDGGNHVTLLNANWSIKPKDQVKLDFRLARARYADHFAVGMEAAGKKGFVTSFDAKFLAHFAASGALDVSRGKVPVEKLALDGSAAAVKELRRCVWIHKANGLGIETGKDRADGIPADPFAADQGRKPKK